MMKTVADKANKVLAFIGKMEGAWKVPIAIVFAVAVISPNNLRGFETVGESDEFIEQYEVISHTATTTEEEDTEEDTEEEEEFKARLQEMHYTE